MPAAQAAPDSDGSKWGATGDGERAGRFSDSDGDLIGLGGRRAAATEGAAVQAGRDRASPRSSSVRSSCGGRESSPMT